MGLEHVDHQQNQIAPSGHGEDLLPSAAAFRSTANQAGHIENLDLRAPMLEETGDHVQRGEVVRSHRAVRVRDLIEQRRLADGRESDETRGRVPALLDGIARPSTAPFETARLLVVLEPSELRLQLADVVLRRLVVRRLLDLVFDRLDLVLEGHTTRQRGVRSPKILFSLQTSRRNHQPYALERSSRGQKLPRSGGGNVVSEGRQTAHPGRGPRGGDPSHTGSLQLACAMDTARPRSPRFRNSPSSCRNSVPLLPRGGPNTGCHILGRFQIRHELDEVLSTHRGLDGDRTNYGGLGSASLDRGGHATLLSDGRLSSTLDLAPRRWSGPVLHLVDGMRLRSRRPRPHQTVQRDVGRVLHVSPHGHGPGDAAHSPPGGPDDPTVPADLRPVLGLTPEEVRLWSS